jgi:hypothetical protein
VTPTGKFVAIWQSDKFFERHYLKRLFEPYISEHILDGKHEVVRDNAILIDAFIYSNDPEYYAAFRSKNAFLVHLGDEFYELGIGRYVHFRGVFRTIWSSVFNTKHVMVLPLGFSINRPNEPSIPASERRYAWSFIGEAEKCSRPEMVHAMSPIEPHICFSSNPVAGTTFFSRAASGTKRIPRTDFVEILRQSAFAPAPMGNASLESCRIYDALECGAIPIVEKRLTLEYFKGLLGDHPLPTVRSWPQARRLVQRLLNDPAKLDNLQLRCTGWWRNYQTELSTRVGAFLAERSNAMAELNPLNSRWATVPGWQYFELLRHQSPRGLLRRIGRQLSRLRTQGRWRESAQRGQIQGLPGGSAGHGKTG